TAALRRRVVAARAHAHHHRRGVRYHRGRAAGPDRQRPAREVCMNPAARERLFGTEHAFDHPVTWIATLGVAGLLAITPPLIQALFKSGRINALLRTELMRRYYSWLVLVPLLLIPILLGAAWTILGVGVLSLLCYREYARATGLFREWLVSIVIVVGIVAVTFAVLDHWYRLFVALTPLTVAAIASVAILADQPKGYIQRVALGVL